jgi:hypothetical protein
VLLEYTYNVTSEVMAKRISNAMIQCCFACNVTMRKNMNVSLDVRVGNRWYPFRIEMDDAMQTDTRTVLQMLEVELDVRVPREVFTLPYLEGGE